VPISYLKPKILYFILLYTEANFYQRSEKGSLVTFEHSMKTHLNKGLFSNYYLDELLPREEEFKQISNPEKYLRPSRPNMKIPFPDFYPLRKSSEKQIGLLIKFISELIYSFVFSPQFKGPVMDKHLKMG